MEKDKYIEEIPAYVLGALSAKERNKLEEHLKTGCAQCANEITEMLTVASLLSISLETRHPSPKVRDRILSALAQEKTYTPVQKISKPGFLDRLTDVFRHRGYGLAYGVTVAILVMVIGFSFYVMSLLRTIDEQKSQIIALKDDVARKEELLAVLQARRVDMVIMNGLEISPEGYGKIIWDPDRKVAILQISNLPAVPNDKDYQLWVIRDKKPVSAGVFAIAKEKEGFFRIAPLVETDLNRINAFAVTLEPKGGVPQPTGKMYLLGTPKVN
ncbi:MAG: anti-sigma factor [Bacteroidota bacterium]